MRGGAGNPAGFALDKVSVGTMGGGGAPAVGVLGKAAGDPRVGTRAAAGARFGGGAGGPAGGPMGEAVGGDTRFTLADVQRLPPCVLLSSCADVTVPW